MSETSNAADIAVSSDEHVAIVEICRPPHNFFDIALIKGLANIFESLDKDPSCRSIVLAAQGTAFCAGADFSRRENAPDVDPTRTSNPLYDEAVRLFACLKPVVAAVHGPAVGGGLGLALVADFRVTCAEARFSANFTRLGFHPGFALTYTLPRLVGVQKAALMFYTGRRLGGEEAVSIGLADFLVAQDQVRSEALKLAKEIAISAPLAIVSTRTTLRTGLAEQARKATAREGSEQSWQRQTEDFKEGIAAMAARRTPLFKGK